MHLSAIVCKTSLISGDNYPPYHYDSLETPSRGYLEASPKVSWSWRSAIRISRSSLWLALIITWHTPKYILDQVYLAVKWWAARQKHLKRDPPRESTALNRLIAVAHTNTAIKRRTSPTKCYKPRLTPKTLDGSNSRAWQSNKPPSVMNYRKATMVYMIKTASIRYTATQKFRLDSR